MLAAVVSFAASGCGFVEQKLADQFFEHDGRLSLADSGAVAEHRRVAADVEPDVHLAEQTRGQDRRDRIVGELVAFVDLIVTTA
jgi:hypothetical protein